ncbi:MAG TPA: DKNYY domain-containing protein [Oligoflexus sp.]|uniref:DKNYY domain-containing protein n=1 Tax=Oligoflexus sp. TaxID=1971216 RepID=UPI002D6A1DE9|nr:DKNYY domain-containing protein [Oligoflexus sp.]HYX34522.1 DKNYY domain-containing protein [Oligoflexus sp.]
MSRYWAAFIGLFVYGLASCKKPDDQKKTITVSLEYIGSQVFTTPAVFEIGVEYGPPLYSGKLVDVDESGIKPVTKFLVASLPQIIELDDSAFRGALGEDFVRYYLRQILGQHEYFPRLSVIRNDHSGDDRHTVRFLLADDLGFGYRRSGADIFYGYARLEGCDPSTFEILDPAHEFSRDAKHVYVGSKVLIEADPSTFEPLEGAYARDARSVFYSIQKLEVKDPNKFVAFPGGVFAKDDVAVFIGNEIMEGAHVPTFVGLSGGYAKDDARVYFFRDSIVGANPGAFRSAGAMAPFPNSYATDDTRVYHKGLVIDVSSASAFRTIDFDRNQKNVPPLYATDGVSLYFKGSRVPGVDLPSFEVMIYATDLIMGRDKNNYYLGGQLGYKEDYEHLSQLEERTNR